MAGIDRRSALAAAVSLAAASVLRSRMPRAAESRLIRLGHINSGSSQLGQGCRAFAAAVAASPQLAGVVEVEIHPDGTAGGELEMVRSCRQGTLDMTFSTSVVAGNFATEVGVLDAPFLFRDARHGRTVLDHGIGADMADLMRRAGVHVLAWGENGMRHVTANIPVRTPSDIRGLRIRVPQSAIMQKGLRALGAAPEQLAFPEVYEALRIGRFDAEENPISTIEAAGFQNVQKCLSLTGHIYSAAFFVASADLLEDLDEAQRTALAGCAVAGAVASRRAADIAERDGIDRLRAAGMTVVTDVDRPAFAALAKPWLASLSAREGSAFVPRITAA